MERHKTIVPHLSRILASVMNDEESRRSVRRRPAGLRSRVRKIDCMLADIQADIQRLRQERIHLGLMREELARMEPK